MDTRAWQARTRLPTCPQPLPSAFAQHSHPFTASRAAEERPGAAQGWLVDTARSPAEDFSPVSSLKMIQRGLRCTQLSLRPNPVSPDKCATTRQPVSGGGMSPSIHWYRQGPCPCFTKQSWVPALRDKAAARTIRSSQSCVAGYTGI